MLCKSMIPSRITRLYCCIFCPERYRKYPMPLIDVRIRSLKPADKPHKYSDGGGLFLFIPPSGSKLWRMAYRFEGKSRLLSFGAYPAVSLKDARERRDEARRLLAKGIDPSAHKRQQ